MLTSRPRRALGVGGLLAVAAACVLGGQSVATWQLNRRVGDAERVVRVLADASPGTTKVDVRSSLGEGGLDVRSDAWGSLGVAVPAGGSVLLFDSYGPPGSVARNMDFVVVFDGSDRVVSLVFRAHPLKL